MKINPNGIKALQTYQNQVNKNKETRGVPKPPAAPQSDRLEISREARDLAGYRRELQKLPEVRQVLVDSLKAKIQAGTYKPSPEKIAEGIIQEKLLDEKV